MGPLPANRETAPMAQSPVRADLHEPLDVHGYRFPEIPFNHSVPLDDIPDSHGLILGQVLHLGINVDAGLLANLGGPALADPIDIGQADLNPLA
jgi:hypothetical protein